EELEKTAKSAWGARGRQFESGHPDFYQGFMPPLKRGHFSIQPHCPFMNEKGAFLRHPFSDQKPGLGRTAGRR
ncbi:MAG TPA: hypothetical protein PLR52_05415, partial [Bacteroidales bacterium]|nr:hypothetical protein [Bacteroidales bacterium]